MAFLIHRNTILILILCFFSIFFYIPIVMAGSSSINQEIINQHRILLDTQTTIIDQVVVNGSTFSIIKYDNLLPYASRIEVFSTNGNKIDRFSDVEPILRSTAWKLASKKIQPSDIQTLREILQTSQDIESSVSPVLSVTDVAVTTINSMKNICINVPFVEKTCVWDIITESYPEMNILADQLETLNIELKEWRYVASTVNSHLPNVITGLENARSGGEIDPYLEMEISESIGGLGNLQFKTNQLSQRLSAIISNLDNAESGIRRASNNPILGSAIIPVADSIADVNRQVTSLKGKVEIYSISLSYQINKLTVVTESANSQIRELTNFWNARQNAAILVYGTLLGIILVIFMIVIFLIKLKKSRNKHLSADDSEFF